VGFESVEFIQIRRFNAAADLKIPRAAREKS
jgi:hypothetical protein